MRKHLGGLGIGCATQRDRWTKEAARVAPAAG
jgi:hypothetical protein